jgi:hypothetical protein
MSDVNKTKPSASLLDGQTAPKQKPPVEERPTGLRYGWMRDYYGVEDRDGNLLKNEKGYIQEGDVRLAEGDQREIRDRHTGGVLASASMQIDGSFKEALLDDLSLHRNLPRADLRGLGAGLHDKVLDRGIFREALFDGADLSNSSMRDAELKGASLKDVKADGLDLSGANLREAKLSGSFRGASFRSADLRGAKLDGDVTGADFSGAILDEDDAAHRKEVMERIRSGKF